MYAQIFMGNGLFSMVSCWEARLLLIEAIHILEDQPLPPNSLLPDIQDRLDDIVRKLVMMITGMECELTENPNLISNSKEHIAYSFFNRRLDLVGDARWAQAEQLMKDLQEAFTVLGDMQQPFMSTDSDDSYRNHLKHVDQCMVTLERVAKTMTIALAGRGCRFLRKK